MKLTYRPEIDGLRAIAVGAVILYHAQITIFGYQPFKGGFIGVDIFFVISGYLITSIILKELLTTDSFSFLHFLERRVRRILPVLLLVILVSLPFSWIYLLPNSLVDFSKSILYSLGFSSNFYFHYSGQQYGAESGLLKPFLHTWSLSVEEQYYIFFPVILLIIFRYFRKYLIHSLILGFTISLGLSDWSSKNYPSVSFYFLHTRMWELLAGSILAYFEITLGHRSKNKKLNLISPAIGLFLIIHSILYFNDEMFHPSLYTLSPIIGVCLIIWFSNKDELITKILSIKLFVGIGLISYSLYLWHYPIFAFARDTEITPKGDIYLKLLFGMIILILSIASYYLVERPFRNKKNKFSIIFGVILISIFISIIYNFSVIKKNGFNNRIPEILSKHSSSELNLNLLKNSNEWSCLSNNKRCEFNTTSNKKIYIIGDSHMASLIFNLKDRIIEKDYQFIYYSCAYYPGFNLMIKKTQKIHKCNDKYFQKLKKILLNEKNSTFIFGGRFPVYLSNYYFDNQEGGVEGEGKKWHNKYISVGIHNDIQSSFKNEVSKLSKNNNIILVYPIPEVGWDPKHKIWVNKDILSKNANLLNITTSYKVYKDRTKSSFELLDSIQDDDVYRVYPHKLFCDIILKNRCVTHDDKNIYYADDDHPSPKGAEMINDLIIKEIKKIELKSN
jgi:peptidoglycan/LPS O-acetylase OafA/YrhL